MPSGRVGPVRDVHALCDGVEDVLVHTALALHHGALRGEGEVRRQLLPEEGVGPHLRDRDPLQRVLRQHPADEVLGTPHAGGESTCHWTVGDILLSGRILVFRYYFKIAWLTLGHGLKMVMLQGVLWEGGDLTY